MLEHGRQLTKRNSRPKTLQDAWLNAQQATQRTTPRPRLVRQVDNGVPADAAGPSEEAQRLPQQVPPSPFARVQWADELSQEEALPSSSESLRWWQTFADDWREGGWLAVLTWLGAGLFALGHTLLFLPYRLWQLLHGHHDPEVVPTAGRSYSAPLSILQAKRSAMTPGSPPDFKRVGSEGNLAQLMRSSISNTESGQLDWRLPWELEMEDLEICKDAQGREIKLGAGGFGEVVLARLRGVNAVAVKRLKAEHTSEVRRREFMREAALLKELANTNIVQFQGACLLDDEMLLVTEHMARGDLFKALALKKVSWHQLGARIAVDVICGLHFLHSRGIVHLDLKSPNILLSSYGAAKLADVGLARIMAQNESGPRMDQTSGTFAWAAPELLTSDNFSEKSDIFSFGVVLWEISTQEKPLRGKMRPVRVPEECPPAVAQLIEQCMSPEPEERPNSRQAYEILQAALTQQRMMRREGRSQSFEPKP